MRALLHANASVVEQIDLPVVLRRIAEAAVVLVGARYGALGVISPHGGLEQFIHVGMDPAAVEEIGHLPEGHGLLGALIDDPRPIRRAHLAGSPGSAGFPAHHPVMESFLGVPIRVRDEVFGNLYLTESRHGAFSAEDEELVVALAATAGIAIENARLFDETREREAWMAASADLTARVLSLDEVDRLGGLADRIREVAAADLVSLVLPENPDDAAAGPIDGLVVAVARGLGAESVEGTRLDAHSLAATVLESGQPTLLDPLADARLTTDEPLWTGRNIGSVMALPLRAEDRRLGVLFIARAPGRPVYRPSDVDRAADLAGQVTVAMELASARSAQQRMLVLEDRGRIARDLHDHVIQELFATGLDLQNATSVLPPASAARVLRAVDRLDRSIAQIRTAIFALSSRGHQAGESLRQRLLALAEPGATGLSSTPAIAFSGPLDLLVRGSLADDVVAVAREALTNIARHADAGSARVSVSLAEDAVHLEVSDDGHGMPRDSTRRSGLQNMADRADRREGSLSIETDPSGTTIRWSAPLAAPLPPNGSPR
ncbi:GAF domain-containing protein [Rathayibacter sp. VKM Ac-2759]|uniref:sensor histidine kinase n=1 Tax=Rathayibacter sp. VKM Ac-2759 TaxID=2609252 RepID=UPI001316EDC5|nr:GAF domain-containing protein [Rathayibacter sp. VKM Ac-2759]QHC66671.1 GAF domain-containing protein [Rathayibacter sp. VKM Ac-2759]